VAGAGFAAMGEVEVDMIAVIYDAGAEHGLEALAGGGEDFMEEAFRLGRLPPVRLDGDGAPVGKGCAKSDESPRAVPPKM
jgi:hypothetical protein